MTAIVADVGGTNTRVGLAVSGEIDRFHVSRYRNAEYASLGDVLSAYISERKLTAPDCVCVALAGPVRHGIGRLTNRDWIVSSDELCRVTGAARGLVLNDLSAQGYALDSVTVAPLMSADNKSAMDAEETRLVVGVGTGFNAAPVYSTPNGSLVVPSECGHITLPIWNSESERLATLLKRHNGFASVEDLLSGRGLPQAFRLYAEEQEFRDPAAILSRAESAPDSLEGKLLDLVVGTLGRVIGDLALIHLPFGGIILIGGMSRALVPFFERASFTDAIRDKGRFSDFMRQFQVFALEDDFAALEGCASFAERN